MLYNSYFKFLISLMNFNRKSFIDYLICLKIVVVIYFFLKKKSKKLIFVDEGNLLDRNIK